MAWTIAAAKESGVFDEIIAVTASSEHAAIAESYGIKSVQRPDYTVEDNSPDIEWVNWFFSGEENYDAFAILRVTSPFRTAETIRAAWETFRTATGIRSLRAVRRVTEHPGKMWVIRHGRLLPLLPMGTEWHSSPTQSLFDCYIQTAGLEIALTDIVRYTGTIAGGTVIPWVLEGVEALDINTRKDWDEAVALVEAGLVERPEGLK
jgi:N-acylneuraminate cytidylyltransferase